MKYYWNACTELCGERTMELLETHQAFSDGIPGKVGN